MSKRCAYCKGGGLRYDSSTKMYYCPKCSRLLDDHEIVSYKKSRKTKMHPVVLIMFNIGMFVPLLNILIVYIINNSDTYDLYKDAYSYRLITDMMLLLIFAGLLLYSGHEYNKEYPYQKYLAKVVLAEMHKFSDKELNTFEPIVINPLDTIAKEPVIEEVHEVSYTTPTFDVACVDGTTVSGKTLIQILETNDQSTILVQTKKLVSKTDENTYRNYGYILDDAVMHNTKDNWYYDGDLKESVLMTDDYGEYVYAPMSEYTETRYVYYVDPKAVFELTLIENNGTVVGFAFKEV